MRVRLGFVSNSSSASFIVKIYGKTAEEMNTYTKYNTKGALTFQNTSYGCFTEEWVSMYNDYRDISNELSNFIASLAFEHINFSCKVEGEE